MTRDVIEKIVSALQTVIKAGYGSVEIIIKDGHVVYINKELREHIEHVG